MLSRGAGSARVSISGPLSRRLHLGGCDRHRPLPPGFGKARTDGNRRSRFDQYLDQHAGYRRGDLGARLVGFDLDQRVVLVDPVSDLLEPGPDRPLDHALAKLRHRDRGQRLCRHHILRA